MSPVPGRRLFLFAAVCALLLAGLRLFILLRFGQLPASAYLPGVLLSLPGEFLAGLAAACLLFGYCRGGACRAVICVMFVMAAAVKIAAFHYEAVFDRLPALQLLFYLGDLDALSASLAMNVPLPFVAGELALICVVLALLLRH